MAADLGEAGEVFVRAEDVRRGEPAARVRVGRQAMVFGEQRLVGAVEWTQQGRSFEGARINAPPLGPLELDLFAMKLQERSSPRSCGAWPTTRAGPF